jgi:hypothetical protein
MNFAVRYLISQKCYFKFLDLLFLGGGVGVGVGVGVFLYFFNVILFKILFIST